MICISIKILSDNTENDNKRLQECDYETFCCIGYAAQKESGMRKSLLPCSHTHTHMFHAISLWQEWLGALLLFSQIPGAGFCLW